MDSYILKLIEENKKLKEQLRKSKNFKRGDVVYVQMRKQILKQVQLKNIQDHI